MFQYIKNYFNYIINTYLLCNYNDNNTIQYMTLKYENEPFLEDDENIYNHINEYEYEYEVQEQDNLHITLKNSTIINKFLYYLYPNKDY